MTRLIPRVIDHFLPEASRGDLHQERQGRVLVLSSWGAALVVALGGAARQVIQPLALVHMALIGLSFLLFAAAPFILRATGNGRFAGRLVTFSFAALLFAFSATSGGLNQPVIVLLPFLPLLGTFLVDRRTGVAVTLLVASFVLVLSVLHHTSHFLDPDLVQAQDLITARSVNILLALLLVTFISGFYEEHRLETERRLRGAWETAEQSSSAKGEFLANMSHEIRTPIGGIIGVADIILGDLDLPQDTREYVEIISSSADGLLHLVNEVLDFSKIEAGMMTAEVLGFRLEEPARGAIELLRASAEQKGLELRLDLDPDLPEWVRSDSARLRQVLLNLVGNAIKFTERGSVELAVRFKRRAGPTAYVEFRVRDTGIGIAPEVREELFQPFTQADSSTARRFGGTGLGLTISRRIVGLLGGEIVVDSIVGKGSSFSFTLPLTMIQKSSVAQESSGVIPKIYASREGCRILVGEDDAVNQMIIRHLLARMGFAADLVDNGHAVLEALAEVRYDLVLMDCQMPELDGYETCRRIRATLTHHVPVIAVTAHATEGAREACLAAGMDDYLTKPYRQKEIAAVLNRWLIVRAAPS